MFQRTNAFSSDCSFSAGRSRSLVAASSLAAAMVATACAPASASPNPAAGAAPARPTGFAVSREQLKTKITLRELRSAETCRSAEIKILPAGTCARTAFEKGERVDYAVERLSRSETILIVRHSSLMACGSHGCSTKVFRTPQPASRRLVASLVSTGHMYRCGLADNEGIAITSDGNNWTCFPISKDVKE
jgi:hypothetical protein